MNKKRLILSSIICALSIATLFIMFMPIVVSPLGEGVSLFTYLSSIDLWYRIEDYLWGIAALISTICLPVIIISSALGILSACGVIKCKKLDKALYIINIIFAAFVVAVIVNYFLGLGRTIGASGLTLFAGTTFFAYSTAFFYLHCVFAIAILVLACLNKDKKKSKK